MRVSSDFLDLIGSRGRNTTKISVHPDFRMRYCDRKGMKSRGLCIAKIITTEGNTCVVRHETKTTIAFEDRVLWGPDMYLPNATTVDLKHFKGSYSVQRIHVKPGTTVIPWAGIKIQIVYDQPGAAGDQTGEPDERAPPPPYADEPPSYDEATKRD